MPPMALFTMSTRASMVGVHCLIKPANSCTVRFKICKILGTKLARPLTNAIIRMNTNLEQIAVSHCGT